MAQIDTIDRPTDAAILLFYIADEVEGITKVQKLLFLIEEETEFGEIYGKNISFGFDPYKMGPFSPQVYDEVTMLLNMGALETEPLDSSGTENWEYNNYTNQESSNELAGKKFIITTKGEKIGEEVANYIEEGVFIDLKKKVKKYNKMPLMALLEYVYSNYEEMTTNSEIKESVLSY